MKIIAWNVNGLRAVAKNGSLENLVFSETPEVMLFQEIKACAEQLVFLDQKFPEYQKFYHSAQKAGYSGTAIWINRPSPHKAGLRTARLVIKDVFYGFPADFGYDDNEGRVLRVDLEISSNLFSIFSVYVPNGGKSEVAWQDKLVFYEKFLDYLQKVRSIGNICLFAGDLNCAHQAIDLARPKENEGVIGFHPLERAKLNQFIAKGWHDIFREKYPEKIVYSWWHVISRARLRNVGWRIDYFFGDEKILNCVKNIEYLTQQLGSDHCPIKLEIV